MWTFCVVTLLNQTTIFQWCWFVGYEWTPKWHVLHRDWSIGWLLNGSPFSRSQQQSHTHNLKHCPCKIELCGNVQELTICSVSNTPHVVFSVTYYSELVNAMSFTENVRFYQIKSIMFYNVISPSNKWIL